MTIADLISLSNLVLLIVNVMLFSCLVISMRTLNHAVRTLENIGSMALVELQQAKGDQPCSNKKTTPTRTMWGD